MLDQLATFLRDRGALLEALPTKRRSPDAVSAVFMRASKLVKLCDEASSQAEVISALVRRVTMAQEKVSIEIARNVLVARLLDQRVALTSGPENRGAITLEVPVRFRRRGVEAKLVIQDQSHAPSEPDANLVEALARAHSWWGMIARGEASGFGGIARAEQLDRTYVTRVICLAFLAPEIAKAILDGHQPIELTAKRLISSATTLPLLWADQTNYFASLGRHRDAK